MGSSCKLYLELPGSKNGHTGVSHLEMKNIKNITSKILIDALCNAVVAVREDSLGFKASKIGTHLICSGAAMQMYLGKCPVYTIMLIRCWSSNAFLR